MPPVGDSFCDAGMNSLHERADLWLCRHAPQMTHGNVSLRGDCRSQPMATDVSLCASIRPITVCREYDTKLQSLSARH